MRLYASLFGDPVRAGEYPLARKHRGAHGIERHCRVQVAVPGSTDAFSVPLAEWNLRVVIRVLLILWPRPKATDLEGRDQHVRHGLHGSQRATANAECSDR